MTVVHALGSQKPLGRHSLALLIGLQLLLVLTVALGGWGASAYLRQLTLTQTLEHAQAQAYNLEDALSQSFHLLKMHLQALGEDHPDLAEQPQQLQVAMAALQQKLPYIRSLSALDGQGQIHISTDPANVGQRLLLGELQHSVAPGAAGVLRFGHSWRGRNFADGTPWPRHREGGLVVDSGFFPVTLVLPGAPQWTLLATINSDYFINLALNHQTSIALRYSVYSDEGTLLLSTDENAQPGTLMPRAEALQDILDRQVGTAHWPQTRAQEAQLAAFRASRSYPWLVLAQAETQEVLRPWRQQTERLAVIATLCVLGLLLVTGSLTWRVRRVLAQEERHLEASRLAASVVTQTHEGVMICDAQWLITDINPAFTRITGYTREQVLGRKPSILSAGRKNQEGYIAMSAALAASGHWSGEFWNRRPDGSVYATANSMNTIADDAGQIAYYINVFHDVTERRQQQEFLESLAHFDPLTRLPNRTLLNDRLAQAVGRAGRAQSLLGVCFLDLDGFKAVNDTWGHEAGDDLLIVIARRLEACVRAEDTVARLGGDEFVVLLTAVTDIAECECAAARILASVREPIDLGGHTVHVGVSIGIALYPQDSDDAETLLRYADMAMYRAKQAGRNRWALHADG